MDFEFDRAAKRLAEEQRKRKEEAERRAERQRKALEEKKKKDEELEALVRQRKEEQDRLEQERRRKEEDEIIRTGGIKFYKMLKATTRDTNLDQDNRPLNESGHKMQELTDKILLPSSCLEELANQEEVQFPMFFELSADGRTTHGGVLEFTAPEGTVVLPQKVMRCLGLDAASLQHTTKMVYVKYVRLPKATFAKLQPQTQDFFEVPEHKQMLETNLRTRYATLTRGDTLFVRHHGTDYELHVTELQPAEGVAVLDTEMSVEIVPPTTDSVGLTTSSKTTNVDSAGIQVMEMEKMYEGSVEQGATKHYKFRLDEALLTVGVDVAISMQLTSNPNDTDAFLYVAAHPIQKPSIYDYDWCTHDFLEPQGQTPTKEIVISPKTSGLYYIGVTGYKGTSTITIKVTTRERKQQGSDSTPTTTAPTTTTTPPPDTAQCPNCKQFIPKTNLAMHEVYCQRHNARCTQCGAVMRSADLQNHCHCPSCGKGVNKSQLQKHTDIFHTPLKCSCGVTLEMEALHKHRKTVCPDRLHHCRFCGDFTKMGGESDDYLDKMWGLSKHESVCGSRTAPCETCGANVVLKMMKNHIDTTHNNNRAPSSPDIRVTSSTENAATVALISCPICNQPLANERALNAHLDSVHQATAASVAIPPSATATGLSCPICNQTVPTERALNTHIDTAHTMQTNPTPSLPTPSSSIQCPVCHQPLLDESTLGVHIDTVHGMEHVPSPPTQYLPPTTNGHGVTCPICDAHLPSERHLSHHIDAVHTM